MHKLSLYLFVGVSVCALTGGCGGSSTSGSSDVPAATPSVKQSPTASLTVEQFDALLGTTGLPLPERQPGETDESYFRRLIADRLDRPEFYEVLGPVLLPIMTSEKHMDFLLKDKLRSATTSKGVEYHFLRRHGDCKGKNVVEVAPWWDLKKKISVCKSSVREDVRADSRAGMSCDAAWVWAENECGCGPNLVYCSPAHELAEGQGWSVGPDMGAPFSMLRINRDEVRRTFQYVVQNRMPYSQLFTMDKTVRVSAGDFWYARSTFLGNGGEFALSPLDERSFSDARLRPRPTEHHGAGILSSPFVLYNDPSQRNVAQNVYTDLLCVQWKAEGVDPHTLVRLTQSAPDLRGAVNKQLVETVGCRDCHVRLEYGMLAIGDFQAGIAGSHYSPHDTERRTKLYVDGPDDLRVEGPAKVDWLANALVSQPDFHPCVVDRVVNFAYGGYPVPDSVRDALLAQFSSQEDTAAILEEALIARLLGDNTP